jgi:hypothetical protein
MERQNAPKAMSLLLKCRLVHEISPVLFQISATMTDLMPDIAGVWSFKTIFQQPDSFKSLWGVQYA